MYGNLLAQTVDFVFKAFKNVLVEYSKTPEGSKELQDIVDALESDPEAAAILEPLISTSDAPNAPKAASTVVNRAPRKNG